MKLYGAGRLPARIRLCLVPPPPDGGSGADAAFTLPDLSALGTVVTGGSAWERWCARRLLGFTEPLPAGWAQAQNPDGGWRSREMKSPVSNMGTTSVTLMRLAFTELGAAPETTRTVDFLWRTQQTDGRWTEDPAQLAARPPEWNQPGNLEVDLWETGNNAAALAALGYAGDPRLERAVAWVQSHAGEDGSFPGYMHTTYAMAAVRQARGEAAAAEHFLQAGLRLLERYGAEPWFDVMDLDWALMLWSLGGVRREHPTVAAYLQALAARRQSDGTWPTRYPGCEAQYNLEAVAVLRAFGAGS